MSDVIIRCPNCGTTQGALGECEACHEGDVRYFCTNHEPGQWLSGPACPACGARYGVDRPKPRPAPRPTTEPPVRHRWSAPPDEWEPIPAEVWTGPVRTPERGEIIGAERGDIDPRAGWGAEPPLMPGTIKIVTATGCVRRLVMLVFILLILAALAVFGVLGIGARLLFGAETPGLDWL